MENPIQNSASLKLHVLASGSRGNAALVQNTHTGEGILIDCGICKRDFFNRCEEVGFDINCLQAVLVTHEHGDHTKGLGVVLRGLQKQGIHPALLTSDAVRLASASIQEVLDQELCDFSSFRGEEALSIAGINVHVFETSHDAAESFGFRFEDAGDAIGFITDTGIVPPAAHEALCGVRILALEANHDPTMLAEGFYPYPIKKRIASDWGHLSNGQSATELSSLLGNRLQTVVAMHISQNNNTYRAPKEALEKVIIQENHSAKICVAYQDRAISV